MTDQVKVSGGILDRQKRVKSIYTTFTNLGLIKHNGVYPGDRVARAIISRALPGARCVKLPDSAVNIFSDLLTLPGESYKVVSPEDFLLMGGAGPVGEQKEQRGNETAGAGRAVLLVDGDLHIDHLEGGQDFPQSGFLRLAVAGRVSISHCPALREMAITCLGSLAIEDCPNLVSLRGEVFGNAGFTFCGITSLGADFQCSGDLFMAGCPAVTKINCEVGGDLAVNNCGIKCTEPAFVVGGNAHIFGCGDLVKMQGLIKGEAQIAGSGREIDCTKLSVWGGEIGAGRMGSDFPHLQDSRTRRGTRID